MAAAAFPSSFLSPIRHHAAHHPPKTSSPPHLSRGALLHLLPLLALAPSSSASEYIDPLFARLRNRYYLVRPGETTFEAAGIVDSNPINKGSSDRGLTPRGAAQVRSTVRALEARGVDAPLIWYDNGARATQTAELIGEELSVSRTRIVPEFRWLEARGLGALDGTSVSFSLPPPLPSRRGVQALCRVLQLREASSKVRALDALDIDNAPEETDDGTPSDSVNEVFSRMRNTVAKIEVNFAGSDVIIVGGDATVLSIFAAAACAVDLREHSRFELPPGDFFDLNELILEVKEGKFTSKAVGSPTDEQIENGRKALREFGPRIFSETEAGSWVLGPGVRR